MPALEVFALDGRTAIVTGGNRGIGQSISVALARSGARVAIIARDPAQNERAVASAREAGLDIDAVAADITDRAQLEAAVARAHEMLGRIDILVNNAGSCVHAPAFEVTDEDWSRVIDLNLNALWNCTRIVGAVMREQGGGSIVNIGSISAMIVNRPQMQPAYNASKAAVHQLTKSLAAEWAPLNIRVNALAPGYVRTEMAPVDRPEFRRHWIDDVPQQRAVSPEEIAPSVVYLASDAAAFATGCVLVVDGGYTLW
jgi:Dehydrogenases with different specificities (related to short-chain alcohol dehydrogenases)